MLTKLRQPKFLLPAIGLAIVLLLLTFVLPGGDPAKELTFTEFNEQVQQGNVSTVTMFDRSNRLDGEFVDEVVCIDDEAAMCQEFKVQYPREYADEITELIGAADPGIDFEVDPQDEGFLTGLFFSLLPVLLLVGVFLFVFNMMQGGGRGVMQFGKAKARKFSKDEPQVTFADVAGADEAIEELREIKDFLQHPDRFKALGAKIPKGVLLYGPPGTGKTLLARAVAGEAGAPFFSISGSDFVEMFVGVGASRVRDLFEQAKNAAPAIIFVDEIDAVGRHRGAGLGGGHDEREQTLNQLLVEMDGFDVSTGVILIAATNRPDILDPALLRPGRFDRQIVVDHPDLIGRRKILEVHAKGKPIAPDVNLETIARRTPGFTGADLANLMNESALLATRFDKKLIGADEIESAIDRVIAGPERKTRVMSTHEKRVIAFHEAGHALVGHVLQHTDPIHKVSIVARGRALGWTLALPEQDKYLKTRSEMRDQMAMLLGGRTAEEMIFGDPTTGAADDIERVTALARSMVTKYGMSDTLGPQTFGNNNDEVFLGKEKGHEANYSNEIAGQIDAEIRQLVEVSHAEARAILTHHRTTLDALAEALIEQETLDQDALRAIFGEPGTWEHSMSSGTSAAPTGVAAPAAPAMGANATISQAVAAPTVNPPAAGE